jgi:hypothetical protein
MEPARSIVQRLGGPAAVARELGLTAGGICRWYTEPPKGAGGRVPSKHVPALCAMAKRVGIFLEPNMFYPKKKKR